jgi:SAM-dependent methyltransferase
LLAEILKLFKHASKPRNIGFCPICERRTIFIEMTEWLRDNYICIRCNSIPRNRALIKVLQEQYPSYRAMKIHESSPGGAASGKLKKECSNYTPTYFYPDLEPGQFHQGIRSENLEHMTFADNSFDLVITQDVLEHVLNPDKAFKEIVRTLKPGGAHVFTVPLHSGNKTVVRAIEQNGQVKYLENKIFHGNPIDEKGALVATDWGDDLPDYIEESTGLTTETYSFNDLHFGLKAWALDVFITRKPIK